MVIALSANARREPPAAQRKRAASFWTRAIHETSDYSFLGHRVRLVAASPLARALAQRGARTFLELFA
ncbi:hypothetical protein JQX13_03840 [Archangium violaceum]|uniref:hypothetical protein n=1 Tax=Archangium violaceum TaxID=83451 RepID=UPI00193C42D8|nr:hypothetical protein [Archangium violaceum]QRK09296.1 hypothetical protein JQX13_03840 [Archangium violaceum]